MELAFERLRSGYKRTADPENPYFCIVSIDIDSDTYEDFKGDTLQIRIEVLQMLEKVSGIYERDVNTKLVLGDLHIWKESSKDPYYGVTNIYEMLNAIQKNAEDKSIFPSFSHMKMYLPTKDFFGAGGVATGKVNVSPWGVINTIAHELGHNFGSPHTQSCGWKGGPLDYCYSTEGTCYEESMENVIGTLMSYCNVQNYHFHPQVQELMGIYIQSALKQAEGLPEKPVFPTFNTLNLSRPYVFWSGSANARAYAVSLAIDPNFDNIVYTDTLNSSVLPYEGFTVGQEYYLKVWALNKNGMSSASETLHIKVSDFKAQMPKILTPTAFSVKDIYDNWEVQFTPVSGADYYEVEWLLDPDRAFLEPREGSMVKTNSTKAFLRGSSFHTDLRFGLRVRAIKDDVAGTWSLVSTQMIDPFSKYAASAVNLANGTNQAAINLRTYYYGPYEMQAKLYNISEGGNAPEQVFDFDSSKFPKFGQLTAFNGLKPNNTYRIDYSFNEEELYPAFGQLKSQRSISFVNRKESAENLEVLDVGGASEISKIRVHNNKVYAVTEKGLLINHLKENRAEIIDMEKSHNFISNTTLAFDFDANGNLWTVQPNARRENNQYVFPAPVAAISKFDERFLWLEREEVSRWPNNTAEYSIEWFDSESGLISGSNGLYSPNNGGISQYISNAHGWLNYIGDDAQYVWLYSNNNGELILWKLKKSDKSIRQTDISDQVNAFGGIRNAILGRDKTIYLQINQQLFSLTEEGQVEPISLSAFGLDNVEKIALDINGNVFVIGTVKYGFGYTMIKQFQGDWVKVKDMPDFNAAFLGNDLIPCENGDFVALYKNVLVRWEICDQEEAVQTLLPEMVIAGDTVQFDVKSCDAGQWEINGQKLASSPDLKLTLTENTPYSFSCDNLSCASTKTVGTVQIVSEIDLEGQAFYFCKEKSVAIATDLNGLSKKGLVEAKLLSATEEQWVFPVDLIEGKLTFELPEGLGLGDYTLDLSSERVKIQTQGELSIHLQGNPEVEVLGERFSCDGDAVSLEANSMDENLNYHWLTANGTELASGDQVNVYSSGLYTLISTNQGGCTSTVDSIEVSIADLGNVALVVENEGYIFPDEDMPFQILGLDTLQDYTFTLFKDGLALPDGQVTASQTGNYAMKVQSEYCETTSKEVKVQVLEGNRIYPNPSKDEMKLYMETEGRVEITNVSGQIFYTEDLSKGKHSVEVKYWPVGSYMVKFVQGKHQEVKRAVVK
ncbi:M12 family metallo-peptidase [Marinilongibacter aquaticus]|uniref:M12 family metallo-peptidase n=1 Tax=Marinilongibacter aquaticus TaxID=2975157 RepID=UPI0021BDD533|nr:M12 family metallo-peptidase [Marinilongibacter aquaticus]UBM58917.1 M12 family metallo-peptidase [Marinilongibacter aquaticus]